MATGGGPPKIENINYWEVQILNLVPVEAVEGLPTWCGGICCRI